MIRLKTLKLQLILFLALAVLLFNFAKFIRARIIGIGLPKGKIVFSAEVDGDIEIYTMNINGAGLKQLTKNSGSTFNYATDTTPCFSSDGKKIVFTSGRQGQDIELMYDQNGKPIGTKSSEGRTSDIYIMDSDGKNQIPLTYKSSYFSPFFFPDNQRIVFHGVKELRLMNTEDGNQRILNKVGGQVKFSPDGKKIIDNFQSDLSISDINGANRVRLTNLLAFEEIKPPRERNMFIGDFDISRDGKKIAFIIEKRIRKIPSGYYSILNFYTMNVDGAGLEEVYEIDSSHLDALYLSEDKKGKFAYIKRFQFSPDNKAIIFLSDFIYKEGIYILNLQDRTVKEIMPRYDIWRQIIDFAVTPDGKKIFFVADIYPFNNPNMLGYMVFLHSYVISNIKYLIFRQASPFYDNKYLCIIDIDGKNYRRIAKLPMGTEFGRDFIHWEELKINRRTK